MRGFGWSLDRHSNYQILFSGLLADSSIELFLLSRAMVYSYDLSQIVSKCDHSGVTRYLNYVLIYTRLQTILD